ncbi:hypothetical protein, partial [Streptococcus pneumoniae]|uniref:hypothetical protein n=1 Tax=Streptococcus pneumoniae TaxID=1313 RepID=UPI000B589A5D
VAFHYRSYGTFFLHKIGSIISIVDLPTTNIIEPKNKASLSKEVLLESQGKRLPVNPFLSKSLFQASL